MPRNPGALSFRDEAQRAQVSETPSFGFNGKLYKTDEVMQSFQEQNEQKQQKRKEAEEQQKQEQEQVEKDRKEAEERQQKDLDEFAKVMEERAGDRPRPRAGSSEQSLKLELVGENQAIVAGQVYDNPKNVTTPQDNMPVQNTATSREVPWQGTIEETRAAQGSVSTVPDAGMSNGQTTEEVTPGGVENVPESPEDNEQPSKRRRR